MSLLTLEGSLVSLFFLLCVCVCVCVCLCVCVCVCVCVVVAVVLVLYGSGMKTVYAFCVQNHGSIENSVM